MLGSHLKALLKKDLLIAKSTFVLTAIEILAPIIIMLALLGLKSLFKKENLSFQEDTDYVLSNASLLFTNLNETFGGQLDEIEDFEYMDSLFMCSENNLVAFVGKDFPRKLAQKFINKAPKGIEGINVEFKYYDDYQTLSDYVESADYGVNEGKICFAVSYQKEGNKYTYKLHYFASPYSNRFELAEIPSTFMGIGERLRSQPDYMSYMLYAYSGFFMSQ